jgi:hypothetical protein
LNTPACGLLLQTGAMHVPIGQKLRMNKVVPISIFQFSPLREDIIEKLTCGDVPGIFIIVAAGDPPSWAFVGSAGESMRARLHTLLRVPGEIQQLAARGATFALVVIRNEAARNAAEAFLVRELCPSLNPDRPPVPDDFDCVIRFFGSDRDHPPYQPKVRKKTPNAA